MEIALHPSNFLDPNLVKSIRCFSSQSESEGGIVTEQAELIYENNWFNMFVPVEYNGLGLSLIAGLCIEEALAFADGSLGWLVTLCSGAAWFSAFLDPEMATILFNNNKVCFAGSGQMGKASLTNEGYEVSGKWKYATGASLATVFTANCTIEQDDVQLKNEDGSPRILSFVFLKDEVTIVEDWQSLGLQATGSHSFSVSKLSIPANRCFRIEGNNAHSKDPLYQYPFLQFAVATLAVNSSGMAVHFLDLFKELIIIKRAVNYPVQRIVYMEKRLEECRYNLNKMRNEFYSAIDSSWKGLANNNIQEKLFIAVTEKSRALAVIARKVSDELYPLCGLDAVRPGTILNQVWRDIHTASQHSLLNFIN